MHFRHIYIFTVNIFSVAWPKRRDIAWCSLVIKSKFNMYLKSQSESYTYFSFFATNDISAKFLTTLPHLLNIIQNNYFQQSVLIMTRRPVTKQSFFSGQTFLIFENQLKWRCQKPATLGKVLCLCELKKLISAKLPCPPMFSKTPGRPSDINTATVFYGLKWNKKI